MLELGTKNFTNEKKKKKKGLTTKLFCLWFCFWTVKLCFVNCCHRLCWYFPKISNVDKQSLLTREERELLAMAVEERKKLCPIALKKRIANLGFIIIII
jgi:hypothetical protein